MHTSKLFTTNDRTLQYLCNNKNIRYSHSLIYVPINTVRCLESLILIKFRLASGSITVSFARHSSILSSWFDSPSWPRPPHHWAFEITLRHSTLAKTPLEKWSARRRDLYPITQGILTKDDINAPGRIRTHIFSKQATANPCLRPRGHKQSSTVANNRMYLKAKG